jgi:predicted nucleic acid-binding protein
LPVVDASAAVQYLLGTPSGQRLAERVGAVTLIDAPHLIDLEIASALRRLVATRVVGAQRGKGAIEDLLALPIRRYPARPLLPRIWELRHTHTAYDASYVALAEALAVPLLTADAHLARSHGHDAQIELLEA